VSHTKVAIIGGGVTGIAASAFFKDSDTVIFEASSQLGGILKDTESCDFNFFSGCQYFDPNAVWFDKLAKKKDFYTFEHLYGSYTDIFGEVTISTNFAGPVCSHSDIVVNPEQRNLAQSLLDRLNLYPSAVSKGLENWFRNININPSSTHSSSIVGFQAGRVYLENTSQDLEVLKRNNETIDSLYGLPREKIGLSNNLASLPYEGFNKVFKSFYNSESQSTDIQLSASVKAEILGNEISLISKGRQIDCDYVLWTADPSPLIYSVSGQKLDSQKFEVEHLNGFLDSKVTSPFYIQVYSTYSKILRIFVYNISGKGCYTIEKARGDEKANQVFEFSQFVLEQFKSFKMKQILKRKKHTRYYAYTTKDHSLLKTFLKSNEISNLLMPDHLLYGRDEKINSVLNQIREKNL